MKRIFSIFLCALMICTILIVPLSAHAEEDDSIVGTWVFNDVLSLDLFEGTASQLYVNGYLTNGTDTITINGFYIVNRNGYCYVQYFISPSNIMSQIYNDGIWQTEYRTVVITDGDDITNETFITWLKANATKQAPCDGSTCPATDVNLDNICDDCGMTFSMVREFTPNDFPSGYPSVPSVEANARYYMFTVYSSNITYLVVYPATVTPTYDTTKQNGYLYFAESYGTYRLDTDNNEWVLSSDESPYIIGGTNNNSVDIHYSSVTIVDQNGENFFPIPLWEKVEQVTQREIPLFSQTLGGNLMTLILCGVGCLTLLVALVLLYKTLRTSLPR